MLNLCKQFQCHEISSKTQKRQHPEIGLEFSGVPSNVMYPKNAQEIEQKHLSSSLMLINSGRVQLFLFTYVSTVLLQKFYIILEKLKRVHFAPRKKIGKSGKNKISSELCSGNKNSIFINEFLLMVKFQVKILLH